MHADTFVKQLAQGSEESAARMQSALNYAYPYALGIFESGENEQQLIESGEFEGEAKLKEKWLQKTSAILTQTGLKIPVVNESKIVYGGRKGLHSEYLKPLLDEMCEVVRLDPQAEW